MSDTKTYQGQCLCGAVKLTAQTASKSVGACHCSMCQTWSGGPLMTMDCGSTVTLEGQEHIKVFSSSEWAERAFCGHCGSHLYYHLKDSNEFIVPAGFFKNTEGMVFDHQIFIDEKPEYYRFANDTKNMTGQEVFDMYAPE